MTPSHPRVCTSLAGKKAYRELSKVSWNTASKNSEHNHSVEAVEGRSIVVSNDKRFSFERNCLQRRWESKKQKGKYELQGR